MSRFTLRVVFESDWHIGSGAGAHDGIDRGVVRDHDGLPFVPAKSMTGMMRDALEEICFSLGSTWDEWVDVIFGSQPAAVASGVRLAPQAAAVSIRPLRFSEALQFEINDQVLARATTFVKPGVSIDRKTKTAKDDHLSFTEMARPGVLSGDVIIDIAPEHEPTVVALLSAAASFIENIGGNRRKGAGKCVVSLINAQNETVTYDDYSLVLAEIAPPAPLQEVVAATDESKLQLDDGTPLEFVDFCITTQTPVLITRRKAGNVVDSHDFIPGSVLLPVLDKWLSAAGVNSRALIAQGRACALQAVPLVDGNRALPASFALRKPKDGGDTWSNSTSHRSEDASSQIITKQIRSGWLSFNAGRAKYASSVAMTASTHNIVDDFLQRPNQQSGGLFTYVSIAAGQKFHGRFAVPASLVKPLKELMSDPQIDVRLGRSKKDDYGQVSINLLDNSQAKTEAVSDSDGLVRIWAASDVLPDDGVTSSDWAQTLASAIGIDIAPSEVRDDLTRIRHRRIDAWQSAWGFPRPSLIGIGQGSCLVLEVDSSKRQHMYNWVGGSIGLRVAEGFGEIAIDHPLLATQSNLTITETQVDRRNVLTSSAGLSNEDQKLLKAVMKSVAREEIRAAALSKSISRGDDNLTRMLGWTKKNPSSSQIGRVRMWVQNESAPITDSARLEQLQHDTKNWDKRSALLLKNLLTDRKVVWELLFGSGAQGPTCLDGRHGLGLDDELWSEAVRAVVESTSRSLTRGSQGGR